MVSHLLVATPEGKKMEKTPEFVKDLETKILDAHQKARTHIQAPEDPV